MGILICLSRQFYSKSLPNILPNSSPIRLQQFRQDAVAHLVNFLEGSLDMVLVPMLKRLRATGVQQAGTYLEKLVNGFLVLVEITINAQVVKCTMYTLDYESLAKESVWKRPSTMKDKLATTHEPLNPIAPQLAKIRAHLTTELNLFDINVYFLEKGLRNREYEYGEAVFRFTKFHRDRVYSSINALEYHTGECAIHFPLVASHHDLCTQVFHFIAQHDSAFGVSALRSPDHQSYIYKTSKHGTFKDIDATGSERKYSAIARAKSSAEDVLSFEFCLLFCAQHSKPSQTDTEKPSPNAADFSEDLLSLEEATSNAQAQFAEAISKACVLYQRDMIWSTLDNLRKGALGEVDERFYSVGLKALEMLSFRCALSAVDTKLQPLLELPKDCWQGGEITLIDQLQSVYGANAVIWGNEQEGRTLLVLPETEMSCHFLLWVEERSEGPPQIDLCFKQKTQSGAAVVEQRLFVTALVQVLSHYVLHLAQ